MYWNQVSIVCVVFLVVFFSIVESTDDDKELELDLKIDHSGYIDPHDMFNYQQNPPHEPYGSKTTLEDSLKTVLKHKSQNGERTVRDEIVEELTKPVSVKDKPWKGPIETCAAKNSTNYEIPFLLRFLHILSNLVSLKDQEIKERETVKVPITASITKQYKAVIEEILSYSDKIPSKKLADIDEVLSNIFSLDEERYLKKVEGFTLQRLIQSANLHAKDWMVAMFLLCVAHALILALLGHSSRGIIIRTIMPLLVISWYWHWHFLDEKAAAKRHSEMVKVSQPPEACNPEALSKWSSVKLFVSTTILGNSDPCDEYHRVLLTDPTYEVGPLLALIDMLAVSIFHPLKYIGEQFGGFFDGVLSSTGFFTKPLVFIAVLLIVLLGLFVMCGYEFHTPLFKITNSRAIAAARIQSATETQVIMENAAYQPLERQARRKSTALKHDGSAVLHVQQVEATILTQSVVEALTQPEDSTPVLCVQHNVPTNQTQQDLQEEASESEIAKFPKKMLDLAIDSHVSEQVTSDIQPCPRNEKATVSSEVENLPSKALEETLSINS